MSADQPVERAATLEDIRAEVLTPDRLNSLVFGVFAAVALAMPWWASRACWRFR
jgi:putative ABC transport system permease protein